MKKFLQSAFILVLLASAGMCFIRAPRGVETDVYALIGSNSPVAALARASADSFRVLCDTPADAAACREAARFDPPLDPKVLYELVRTKGGGLLSERHRTLLMAGETNKIARSALRRDYAGVGLFPKEDDPYYFLDDFVLSFKNFRPQLKDGAELLTGSLAANDPSAISALIKLARTRVGVHLSGAPFHAYLATEATKCEVNLLGGLSLIAVFLIGFWLFRSFRFVLPLVFALVAGFVIGAAAILLMPERPHALTFLFGTSLIGLGVDYCYHALKDHSPQLGGNLTAALITTVLSFVPLLFSSVSVLNQMAVFTISGLVAIYVVARLWMRSSSQPISDAADSPTTRWLISRLPKVVVIGVRMLFVALLIFGVLRISFANDPSRFHVMDPMLAAGERAVMESTGLAGLRFHPVPLDDWQQENLQLKSRMDEKPKGALLTAADLPRGMTLTIDARIYLLLPSAVGINLKVELQRFFDSLAHETYWLLLIAFGVMFAFLLITLRRRFLVTAKPLVLAILSTIAVLGWLGEPLTFFQLLCFFVLTGLAVDYVLFHQGGGCSSTVFASFLTSAIGFGLLTLTSFAVTRTMGITIACGLVFAYLFSIPSSNHVDHKVVGWAEQKEQSSGRFRLTLLFTSYRLFGKSFAKIIIFFVVLAIYPFAKAICVAVRKNLALLGTDPKKCAPLAVFLNFAWSLMDKVDACSLQRKLPKMTVVGDRDWMSGGCFLLATHVGTIGVLPALNPSSFHPKLHAFQQMTHDKVFTDFFERWRDKSRFELHAVEDIGVETAVEMQAAIQRGEIVLMAADRPSASAAGSRVPLRQSLLGREIAFPKGVFRFAKLMESPVFAITCVRTGWNAYTVEARRMGTDILKDYAAFLEAAIRKNPEQWYQFYDIMGGEDAP